MKFTLNDRLVQYIFRSLSENHEKVKDTEGSLDPVIVGGMAVQSYSPSNDLYRPTNDIDLIPDGRITNGEFKDSLGDKIVDYLSEKGYSCEFRESQFSHEMECSDNDTPFFLHLNNYTENYWDKHKDWKKREIENAREKMVYEVAGEVLVHRLEDVMANKARNIRKLHEDGYVNEELEEDWYKFLEGEFEELGSYDLDEKLEEVVEKKGKILDKTFSGMSKQEKKEYQAQKHLYDVALLCRAVLESEEDFEGEYYAEALKVFDDGDLIKAASKFEESE